MSSDQNLIFIRHQALTFVADNSNTHGLQMKKSTYLTADLVLLIE